MWPHRWIIAWKMLFAVTISALWKFELCLWGFYILKCSLHELERQLCHRLITEDQTSPYYTTALIKTIK